VPLLCNL